jgi:predicted ATPase/class 3 adenylate cyclase
MSLPGGTVTFLFTDIEGSTQLWEQHVEAMSGALARHEALLREAIEAHGGHVFKTMGDAVCAVFADAAEALTAALEAQRALSADAWGAGVELRVRMALHTGAAEPREGDYLGPALNRVSRLRSAAHGGQTLVSRATYELVRERLPKGASLRDLGEHRLRDLSHAEHVFQLVHADLPADFPPLRSLQALSHNLPVQLTSFIGREREMGEVKGLLARTRLLTLVGVGGAGKTRLALQVAAELVEDYGDGVWLTELAALADPGLVPQTLASAIGVREQPGRAITETLLERLRAKSCLLVLDNCEHLLEACARLTEGLLRNCPEVRVLASSREGLGIAGETTYHVLSLSVPESEREATPDTLAPCDSARLFLDRAQSHHPSFGITDRNAPAVAQICRRLDGIPLAIELAAARVRAMPVEQLAGRLSDCFRLLTGGSRTALPRQQTLKAALDWSYDLLAEQEKVLYARLSVFAGGCTLEAAEAVCSGEGIADSDVLDLLTSLVDKSMAVYTHRPGEARYTLLETMRQYARDRLAESGEAPSVRDRHRDCFLAQMMGDDKTAEWFARMETEHDNLRGALDWCQEPGGDREAGLRLAERLYVFWRNAHIEEGRQRLTEALAGVGSARTAERGWALHRVGWLASFAGAHTEAWTHFEESLAICRELGRQDMAAYALHGLGFVAWLQGDNSRARELYEEGLQLHRRLGMQGGVAQGLDLLCQLALFEGDYAAARAAGEESIALRRVLGDRRSLAFSLHSLGTVATAEGNLCEARELHCESLAIRRELGDKGNVAVSLDHLAALCAAEAKALMAARLFGAAAAFLEALGVPRFAPTEEWLRQKEDAVRQALGTEAFERAYAEGRAMTMEEAVEYALQTDPT